MSYAIFGTPPRFADAHRLILDDLQEKARVEISLGQPFLGSMSDLDWEALGKVLLFAAERDRPFAILPSVPPGRGSFLAFVSYEPALDMRSWPWDTRACRVCGCVDDDCRFCIERTGVPCHWVEQDLCSACSTRPAPEVAGL